ncbi:MAG: serine O-acetyltransferase [Deltaproteobacteria bacterium]|nr:serine O-acetyltransferase [Deltaproteobacteria bacterium]MBW2697094.1 serine O-acetyltransferase [Deltaproteobacteria bacterium]
MAPPPAPGEPASGGPDPIWSSIRSDVAAEVEREPLLASFLQATVLGHSRLEDALSFHLAEKLATSRLPATPLREMIDEAFCASPAIGAALRADLAAARERDPACATYWVPLLYFKGFHALETHRIAHWLWEQGRTSMARHLQNRVSELFGVDIHPAARIGQGIFIDHATGVVMGETCVVEDDVSMLHEVTLGGTGKETGDRHPKVRRGVLICAGAKVLGNVEVGEGAKIAAGSVVLDDVPPHCTVAGVPAEIVGTPAVDQPALEMDARINRDD